MQFDTYLFDFDGTLFDTRESLVPVFQAGYAVVGRPVTAEEASRWMHLNLYQSLKDSGIAKEDYPIVIRAIIDSLDLPESLELIKPFEETMEVLRALHQQGKRLGIVSNNGSQHIRLVLETLGVDVPFDCIVGSDMFQNGKPHREPIDLALKLLGEESRDSIVYVGDSLQDAECGQNAEISGILVDREDLHPDFVGTRIHSLKDLL